MSSTSSATKRLKKLLSEIPTDRITRGLMIALQQHNTAMSDRSIAIMGSSLVEKSLEISIRSRFAPITEPDRLGIFSYDYNGPLADFSSRIKVGFALGLFGPKTRVDLDHVRTVRNAFAHSVQFLSFDTKEISDICMKLNIPKTVTIAGGGGGTTGREFYVCATITLAERLQAAIQQRGIGMLSNIIWNTLLP